MAQTSPLMCALDQTGNRGLAQMLLGRVGGWGAYIKSYVCASREKCCGRHDSMWAILGSFYVDRKPLSSSSPK